MAPSRDSYRFGRSEMLDYLSALDEALSGGPPVHLIVCGGASMIWRYDDRLSSDIDVLNSLLDDRTHAAVLEVAGRFGIHHDWMNDSVSRHQLLPHFERERMYTGRNLTVDSVSGQALIAMKVLAGRDNDLRDAARLAADLDVTTYDEIYDAVTETYDWEFPGGTADWSDNIEPILARAAELRTKQGKVGLWQRLRRLVRDDKTRYPSEMKPR
ncbi:DUF6036 family nucleotidyltransferase [Candidatus Poriferisodalis sp.]|uniref:DUF6036 family nucleotidyltransferase n=1 Tax=Candidatus Poriferisodalis sp. TaxID=3101277 RepID=UPI003B025269